MKVSITKEFNSSDAITLIRDIKCVNPILVTFIFDKHPPGASLAAISLIKEAGVSINIISSDYVVGLLNKVEGFLY